MRIASILCLTLVAGCNDQGEFDPFYDGESSDDPPGPMGPRFVSSLHPTHHCGYSFERCAIAAGGADVVTVQINDGLDVDLEAGGGAQVHKGAFANQYLVTTAAEPAVIPLTLGSSNFPPKRVDAVSAAVRDVRIVPEHAYRQATTAQVAYVNEFHARRFVVAIEGPPEGVTGAEGPTKARLVDASLALSLTGASELDWDRFELPAQTGVHAVVLTADSFGTRRFDLEVVDAIDRIEATIDGQPAVGTATEVCFYAYAGEREVYSLFSIVDEPATLSSKLGHNCRVIKPTYARSYSITAQAFGKSHTVEIDVP